MENISNELIKHYKSNEVQEFINAPLGDPNMTELKARSNGNASYKEKWRAFPENKPEREMKCVAELWYKENEHTTLKYLWCVYWDGSEFRDYGGNTDLQDGAIVKYFIMDDDLRRPQTT